MNKISTEALGGHALSRAQRLMWFDQVLNPGAIHYNIGTAIRLDGDVNPAILQRAINNVADVHDALRLTLSDSEQRPEQRVLTEANAFLTLVDYSREAK